MVSPLYPGPSSKFGSVIPVLVAVHVSINIWHHRFNHLHRRSLARLQNSIKLPTSQSKFNNCVACNNGKSHWLLFDNSSHRASFPLVLIQTDVLTSPITSCSGFKYLYYKLITILDTHGYFRWKEKLKFQSTSTTSGFKSRTYATLKYDVFNLMEEGNTPASPSPHIWWLTTSLTAFPTPTLCHRMDLPKGGFDTYRNRSDNAFTCVCPAHILGRYRPCRNIYNQSVEPHLLFITRLPSRPCLAFNRTVLPCGCVTVYVIYNCQHTRPASSAWSPSPFSFLATPSTRKIIIVLTVWWEKSTSADMSNLQKKISYSRMRHTPRLQHHYRMSQCLSSHFDTYRPTTLHPLSCLTQISQLHHMIHPIQICPKQVKKNLHSPRPTHLPEMILQVYM